MLMSRWFYVALFGSVGVWLGVILAAAWLR
jgi:hypothetical protein